MSESIRRRVFVLVLTTTLAGALPDSRAAAEPQFRPAPVVAAEGRGLFVWVQTLLVSIFGENEDDVSVYGEDGDDEGNEDDEEQTTFVDPNG